MFLVIQGHMPIETAEEGEAFYNELKNIVKSWNENSIFSGQITKHMEPCCKQGEKGAINAAIPPLLQRKSPIPFGR